MGPAVLWWGAGCTLRLPCAGAGAVLCAVSHRLCVTSLLWHGHGQVRMTSSAPLVSPWLWWWSYCSLLLVWELWQQGLVAALRGPWGLQKRPCKEMVSAGGCWESCLLIEAVHRAVVSTALSDVWLLFSHGLAAHSQSCQTFLGFINQVMSRVWASVSALALVPVKTNLWKKPKCMCSGSREPQPAPRCASVPLVTPQEKHWPLQRGFAACLGAVSTGVIPIRASNIR